jgi:hypothetical protein
MKLIIIEGIPGAGKTTTARYVADWLEKNGYQRAPFFEGDWNHPADYESVACLTDQEYLGIQSKFPDHAEFITNHSWKVNRDWYFKYGELQRANKGQLPDGLFDAFKPFDIYALPSEKYQRLLLQNWQRFAKQAAAEETVYVFECCFLQNPITTLIAQHNLPKKTIYEHIQALTETVVQLRPKIVYLEQTDVCKTLENIRSIRSQEWTDFVTWYLTEQEYGKARQLSGFEGVIDFYTMRQKLELDLLDNLPISSLVLADTTNWDDRYQKLNSFLAK